MGKQNSKLIKNMENLDKKEPIKLDKYLEKIIIAVSKPLIISESKLDSDMNKYYKDSNSVVGKMIFIANKEKYERWLEWMELNDQNKEIDEIYIYDRFHIDGNDMIERSSIMLHEFSYAITLKDKYKKCWFNQEINGCKLYREFAIDPFNEAWA
tara:strand:- start:2009 stop:2470 length:462 start_codon:yes stop_codon:yes gene_type:complete